MIPWWGTLLIQLLNLLISNSAVFGATYYASGDANLPAAIVATAGSLIQTFRANPFTISPQSSVKV